MSISNFRVDAASALTAVCAYHPLRTTATRIMAGLPFTMRPKSLYAGFAPSLAAAHQLFVISFVYHSINSKEADARAAIAAGLASASSATLCEAFAVRQQAQVALVSKSINMAFRGFTPMVFRQMGIASGMFVFPAWIEKRVAFGNKKIHSFLGGAIAALCTQYPDTVRVIMQAEQKVSMQDAGRLAWKKMMSRSGAATCFVRIGVLSTASVTMHWGKKNFPILFNNQES
jgi:hypothetical protein